MEELEVETREWKFIIHEIINDYGPYDSFTAIEQRRLIPL